MYCEMSGWNPFKAVKTAFGSAFAVSKSVAKSTLPAFTGSLPGALPQILPAVVDTTLSTVPVVVDRALDIPIAVSTPLIKVGVETGTKVMLPQVEAPKMQKLVVPGYKQTETGEIVKEVNLKDFVSLIPLSGLAWLALAL